MEKTIVEKGQMFILFPKPIEDNQPNPTPSVWVKIDNAENGNYSVFANNRAIVELSIGRLKEVPSYDKWLISDEYYGYMTRKGLIVPISDLREVVDVCEQMGYEMPELPI